MSLWRLIRGEHGVLAAVASTASYVIAGGGDLTTAAVLATSTFLAEAGLFAHNDLSNLEEDRVNRPNAPLVKGLVSLDTARAVAYGSLAFGGVLSMWLGSAPFAIYLTAVVVGMAYNARLKKTPLLGNLAVAFLTSMTYLYGMAAAGSVSAVLILLFTSSLVANVGREIVKTAIDHQGDLKAGVRTVAVVLGPQTAARLGACVTAASAAPGLALVFASHSAGLYFLTAAAAITSVVLIYLSLAAAGGKWEMFRSGTLLAFGITLVALAAEAVWRLC